MQFDCLMSDQFWKNDSAYLENSRLIGLNNKGPFLKNKTLCILQKRMCILYGLFTNHRAIIFSSRKPSSLSPLVSSLFYCMNCIICLLMNLELENQQGYLNSYTTEHWWCWKLIFDPERDPDIHLPVTKAFLHKYI